MATGCGQPPASVHGQRLEGRAETMEPGHHLLTRTSWVDAAVAYGEVKQGRAKGNLRALALRRLLQRHFYALGSFVHLHNGKVLILGLLALSLCSVGLKSWRLETNIERLWVADGGRLEKELNYTKTQLGVGYGLLNPVIIQSPEQADESVLTRDSLLLHLQALTEAVSVEVNMYNLVWRFEDICFKPSFPTFEKNILDKVLTKMLPCVIMTPLDCFWEGSKILGPFSPLRLPTALGIEPLTWTTLDPQGLMEMLKARMSMVDLEHLGDVMQRAGVTTGYQRKPCLDPRDPRCPFTAPNYRSRTVDIGAALTGGCTGFAAKRMHWQEDLIVGGVRRNRSGSIVYARALQSVLQLMGEQELYDAYADDHRVSATSWSADKAAKILSVWQQKFTDRMLAVAANASSAAATAAGHGSTLASFTELSLEDILVDFSVISYIRVGVGCGLMLIYACLTFVNYDDAVRSQFSLGMAGMILVALSIAGGLGFCSVVQMPSNAATTQVIPFLALGLGISDIFYVSHALSEVGSMSGAAAASSEHPTAEMLKRIGPTILLTSACKISCAFLGVLIPVPSLQAFSLQLGVLVLFSSLTILLLFPAVCSIDAWRRSERRIDLLCCLESRGRSRCVASYAVPATARSTPSGSSADDDVEAGGRTMPLAEAASRRAASGSSRHLPLLLPQPQQPPPYAGVPLAWASESFVPHPAARGRDTLAVSGGRGGGGGRASTILASTASASHGASQLQSPPPDYDSAAARTATSGSLPPSACSSRQSLTSTSSSEPPPAFCCRRRCVRARRRCCSISLQQVARVYVSPYLQKSFTKACVIVGALTAIGLSGYGISRVEDGMDLSEIVPRDTHEYNFLELQSRYFGFYNMYIVTKDDADYASRRGQQLLRELHRSFAGVSSIVRDRNGSLPVLWLDVFVDWLQGLQRAVDADVARGCFSPTRGSFRNGSTEGALGFLLLSQTGNPDDPIDYSRYKRVRLVDGDGYVPAETFYQLLTAWSNSDVTAYDLSQANLRPTPASWSFDPHERDVVPRSADISYAQMAFFLNSLGSSAHIVSIIGEVRAICDKYTALGLPSYPSGAPFTYWEQYTALRPKLALALGIAFAGIFVILLAGTAGVRLGTVVIGVLAVVFVELFGFMGLVGLRMSAVPAVVLIGSLGSAVQFVAHVATAFVTSVGPRDVRMARALEHALPPVVRAGVAVAVGITPLVGSDFDFIVRYFLYVVLAHVALCLLNGLVLLPVLLSLAGPAGDIEPLDPLADCIEPPPPPPVAPPESPSHGVGHRLPSSLLQPPPPAKQKARSIRMYPRVPSEISLSTISEEPTQLSSHDIVIEPKVQIETRTVPSTAALSSSSSTASDESEDACARVVEHVCPTTRMTTTIRATTTVKVEVHTSLPGSVCDVEHQQAKRKKRKQGGSDYSPDSDESAI